jgi:homocysteine S-methyltransferase
MDGAMGTELEGRGVDTSSPSWTARALLEAPDVVRQIHDDYVAAGAELITANTFRTHARSLRSIGREADARELTRQAVQFAKAAAGSEAYVAGSVAPLEDCYSPHLTPGESALAAEHDELARNLADAGVDVILIETQLTIREAVLACQAARRTGVPCCVSFVCGRNGALLSGESLLDAYWAVAEFRPSAFLVNCTPGEEVLSALQPCLSLRERIPLGAYANTGRLLPNGTWEATAGISPAVYAEYAQTWLEAGLQLIGGCCGTRPAHISALREII